MVVVALAGIVRLWTAQRRRVPAMRSVEGFASDLRRLSARAIPAEPTPATVPTLDDERRAAAKRRIEARRAQRRAG